MKICWDNIEGVKLTRNGIFLKNGRHSFIYRESCAYCKDPYLDNKHKQSKFCCHSCAGSGENHWAYGKPLTEEHKKNLTNAFAGEKNHFYGKKHTKASKDLIGVKATGRTVSIETRKRMSRSRKLRAISDSERLLRSKIFRGKNNPMYGRRGKLSPNYGIKRSEATKKKLSLARKDKNLGPDNPNWKGGISFEPYCCVWSDKEYKAAIRDRDNSICQNPYCYKTSKRLAIHHIDYDKKNCHPSNLITVCGPCNSRANKDRKWHTKWYQTLIGKKY